MLANYSKALLLQAGEYNTSLVTLEYTHTSIHSHNHTFYILYYHNDSLELYHCFSVCFLFFFFFYKGTSCNVYRKHSHLGSLWSNIYISLGVIGAWPLSCCPCSLCWLEKIPKFPCLFWSLAVLVHCDAGHSWGFRWSGRWLGTPCFILALGEGC